MKTIAASMAAVMLLSAFSGAVGAAPTALAAVPLASPMKFDFGSVTSPAADGYLPVTNETMYSSERGYGLLKEGKFDSRDRKKFDDLQRDFILHPDYVFLVDVPNGQYHVTVMAGDAITGIQTNVAVEGGEPGVITAEEGKFEQYKRLVTVSDGQLNIDLSERVNAVTIRQAGDTPAVDLRFDFGPDTSPVAAGYTQVTPTTEYSVERGYGLQPDYIDAYDRETPDDVRRDFIMNDKFAFLADVPNGGYFVKVIAGDAAAANKTDISIEGKEKVVLSSAAGSFEEYTDMVYVSDGQLNLAVSEQGRLNGVEISPIPVPAGLSLKDMTLTPVSSASIAWSPVEGAAGYAVYRKQEADSEFVKIADVQTNEFKDLEVELGFSYTYTVASVFSGGESGQSPALQVKLVDESAPVPAAPKLALGEVTKEAVSLEWSRVKHADAYYIYRSAETGAAYEKIGTSTKPGYTDQGVVTSKPYHYKVYAVSEGGLSEPSGELTSPITTEPLRQMEKLDRAPVAVKTAGGVLVSWRLLGTDPEAIGFNVYRDGQLLTDSPITASTNFVDVQGTADSQYRIDAVVKGVLYGEQSHARVLANNYFDIPLNKPADSVTPAGAAYSYRANDASVGDLDGDGQYELVVKWDPTNSKDNSQSGVTGNVYVDAYEFDGTQLWRIDLGVNIRAGAHYTQFMVYDFDGNGQAEVAFKTADGTRDGQGTVIGDTYADYRNANGYILQGSEFLTIFNGRTGAAMDTVQYEPPRGNIADWGDNYGNRGDRFLAGVAYLNGETPSLIMARGYYTRTVLVAYNFVNGKLEPQWTFDTKNEGYGDWGGQGYHSLSVADVDQDGKDEVVYGQISIDDDGTGLYNSRLGHGDALHVGDLVPGREGLEIFAVQENTSSPYGYNMRDAKTGEVLWGYKTGQDTGRGLTADIDPRYEGSESWAIRGEWNSTVGGIHKADGEKISESIPSSNFAIWWDGDPLRELLDHNWNEAAKAGVGKIDKWDYENNKLVNLLLANGTYSNNSTKGTPALQADLFGDWRKEDSSALRVYLTPEATEHRIYTLMHDPQYRVAIAWQNAGYNQPPHPSFFIGNGMEAAPAPHIYLRDKYEAKVDIQPGTLNLKSRGGDKFITARISLASEQLELVASAGMVLKVNGHAITAAEAKRSGKSWTAKFDRQQVQEAFEGVNGEIEVELLVYAYDGTVFIGRDSIKVIH